MTTSFSRPNFEEAFREAIKKRCPIVIHCKRPTGERVRVLDLTYEVLNKLLLDESYRRCQGELAKIKGAKAVTISLECHKC